MRSSTFETFSKVDSYSITLDGWSSKSNIKYLGIKINFIDQNFIWVNKVLEFELFNISNMSENLKELTVKKLKENNLNVENLLTVTSDNVSNIVGMFNFDELNNIIHNLALHL